MTLVRQSFTEPLYALTDIRVILIMLGTNGIIMALKGSGHSRVFLANWKSCAGEPEQYGSMRFGTHLFVFFLTSIIFLFYL